MERTYLNDLFDFLKDRIDELTSDEADQLCWRYEDDYNECEIEGWHQDIVDKLGCSRYDLGCSKIVLFFDEYPDIVVKIPFDGIRDVDYEKDFEVTNERHFIHNYCEEELDIWYEAIEANVEEVFAEEAYIGQYRNISLYAAECCAMNYWYAVDEPSEDSKAKAKKITDGIYSEVNEYIPTIIEQHGEEFAEKVFKFIEEFEIDDLHDGNVGFKNGLFKFVDYSSYDDQEKGNNHESYVQGICI